MTLQPSYPGEGTSVGVFVGASVDVIVGASVGVIVGEGSGVLVDVSLAGGTIVGEGASAAGAVAQATEKCPASSNKAFIETFIDFDFEFPREERPWAPPSAAG